MKLTVAAILGCFVLALAFSATPASADVKKAVKATVTAPSAGVTELGKPPNVPPTTKPVTPPGGKPDRSQRNPNDGGKDEDPNDGDAGSGNDDKTKKNDQD